MQTQQIDDVRVRYEEDGYHIEARPLLPADVVARGVLGMDAVRDGRYETGVEPPKSHWTPGDPPDKLVKVEIPQVADRAVFDVVSHPAIGEIAGRITGAEMVQVWWVQLLIKPSTEGESKTNVGWHQDRSYWNVWEPGSELFTAWVALSDVTEDSGPMMFVPRSHTWGLYGQSDFFGQQLDAQAAAVTVPEGETWRVVPAILPPGGVSFHDDLTFHASGPNRSGRPRRSFALHLRTEKSRPINDERVGLAQHIDNPDICPIIFRR